MTDYESRVTALEAALRAVQARLAEDEAAGESAMRKLRSLAMRHETPPALAEILQRAGLD